MAAALPASLDARLYRAALLLCPGEFRREHGDEMACDFDEARGELATARVRTVWWLRFHMGVDLARTIVVQWLRTGLPAIGCAAACVSLGLTAGLASVARRVTAHIPAAADSEILGVVLLAAIAVMVIVMTIVFNLWVHRPRRARRR